MRLVELVTVLAGRELTAAESAILANFQAENQIDDSDPLIAVLALMARSHLIVDRLPQLLQERATETIELHQRTLREQSTLIAKELVLAIAQDIQAAHVDWKARWVMYGVFFAAGAIVTAVATRLIH